MLLVALQCFSIPFDAAPEPHRKPIPDQVYLQETSQKILLSAPLTTVAAFEGQVYAGTKHGLYVLSSGQLIAVQAVREPVRHLRKINNALWAVTEGGLHWYQSNVWQKLSGQAISDIAGHLSEVIAANGKRLYRVRDQSLQPLTEIESPFLIQRVISHCESLYIYGGGERLTFFNGKGFGGLDVYGFPVDQNWDWGALPSRTTRDILSQDNRIYFATENGLGLLRGMSLTSIRGEHGLCYEDTTCLAEGFTNDLWIGTTRGAIRFMDGHFQYFAGKRWLPDDHVQAIAADRHAVYIATAKGLGIIRYVPFTLARKADYYEHHLEKWGQKRLGFTHKLEWDASLNEFVREVSDNDGGYSGNYLAAQCFRYAVTKDSKARQEAVNTFNSLLWLEAMTGIPGLPARSVWAKGEQGHKAMHGSGGYEAEWHDTADGKFEWKGDTSSDEICSP